MVQKKESGLFNSIAAGCWQGHLATNGITVVADVNPGADPKESESTTDVGEFAC